MILVGLAAAATLRVEVLAEPRTWDPALTAVLHRVGGDERLPLAPLPDRPGFYGASSEGPGARVMDVELVGRTTRWRRVVPLSADDTTLTFRVEEGQDPVRVAWLPATATFPEGGSVVSLAVAFGWGTLCFGYVAWLARAPR